MRRFHRGHALFGEELADRANQPARGKSGRVAAGGRKLQKDGARRIRPQDSAMDQFSVVQRDTKKEAEEYLHRYAVEYLDNEVMDSIMATISTENNIPTGSEQLPRCGGEWR